MFTISSDGGGLLDDRGTILHRAKDLGGALEKVASESVKFADRLLDDSYVEIEKKEKLLSLFEKEDFSTFMTSKI